jgi:hypothetical protein
MRMRIHGITTGCVAHRNRDVPVFALQISDHPGTTPAVRLGEEWFTYDTLDWTVIGMASAQLDGDLRILGLGSRGQLWELTPADRRVTLSAIVGDHELTNLAAIGDTVWACGMGHVVMRRESGGTWTDASVPSPGQGVRGFTALAGDATELVGVGWQGEIWARRGDAWHREPSPAQATLNAISIADGEAIAVGDRGSMVVRRDGTWKALDVPDLDLTSVSHHRGEIYVGSTRGLLRLQGGTLVAETRFVAEDAPSAVAHLVPGRESLFSIDERSIFQLADGTWSRLV